MNADWAGPPVVLFDLDGTLTASGPGILASVRHALRALGEPIPDEAVLAAFIGPPLLDSFTGPCGLPPARAQDAIAAYREHYSEQGQYENSVYAGVPELLGALTDAGRTVALATSKAQVYAESILAHFGLTGFFTVVVGSELDGRRTRKAEVIAEVLARLDRPAADCVMIGDRAHDVIGALAVGMPCVGVLWGYGSAQELASAGADALVRAPADLHALLLPASMR
ncbi:MAG: HAD hydrolase-like protein [Candidatus Nanopelagicales bacterium]